MIKPIKDYEGYFISDDGNVFCNLGKGNRRTGKIVELYEVKPKYTKTGYAQICARNNKTNKRVYLYIHRLVAQHFIPPERDKRYVNHKNCIRSVIRVDNLEWCTAKENTDQTAKIAHIIRDKNGRYKSNFNYEAIVIGGF